MSGHTPAFQRYIEQGWDAARTHPDYESLEPWTTAKDTIASILHWVEDVWDEEGDGGKFDAESLLASAHLGYLGDFEDDCV